jgi:hypothetical protein
MKVWTFGGAALLLAPLSHAAHAATVLAYYQDPDAPSVWSGALGGALRGAIIGGVIGGLVYLVGLAGRKKKRNADNDPAKRP